MYKEDIRGTGQNSWAIPRPGFLRKKVGRRDFSTKKSGANKTFFKEIFHKTRTRYPLDFTVARMKSSTPFK